MSGRDLKTGSVPSVSIVHSLRFEGLGPLALVSMPELHPAEVDTHVDFQVDDEPNFSTRETVSAKGHEFWRHRNITVRENRTKIRKIIYGFKR